MGISFEKATESQRNELVYVNADKSQIVDENSPEAAWQLSVEEADKLGLRKSGTEQSEPASEPAPDSGSGPESADDENTGAGSEADGETTAQPRPQVKDKAVRGPRE